MEENQNNHLQKITEKQEALLLQLLQSAYVTRSTREKICSLIRKRGLTAYEAILAIDLVLREIRFRRRVLGLKARSLVKCVECANRLNLTRSIDANNERKQWVCTDCRRKQGFSEVQLEELKNGN